MPYKIVNGERVYYRDALDVAIECSTAGKPYEWRTSNGVATRPKDMTESHLKNTIVLVAKRYRQRLMGKATRLFAASALPNATEQSSAMIAKAHYWMSVAQNAAAVYDRVVSIPIIRKMVRVLKEEYDVEFTWRSMMDYVPTDDTGRDWNSPEAVAARIAKQHNLSPAKEVRIAESIRQQRELKASFPGRPDTTNFSSRPCDVKFNQRTNFSGPTTSEKYDAKFGRYPRNVDVMTHARDAFAQGLNKKALDDLWPSEFDHHEVPFG